VPRVFVCNVIETVALMIMKLSEQAGNDTVFKFL